MSQAQSYSSILEKTPFVADPFLGDSIEKKALAVTISKEIEKIELEETLIKNFIAEQKLKHTQIETELQNIGQKPESQVQEAQKKQEADKAEAADYLARLQTQKAQLEKGLQQTNEQIESLMKKLAENKDQLDYLNTLVKDPSHLIAPILAAQNQQRRQVAATKVKENLTTGLDAIAKKIGITVTAAEKQQAAASIEKFQEKQEKNQVSAAEVQKRYLDSVEKNEAHRPETAEKAEERASRQSATRVHVELLEGVRANMQLHFRFRQILKEILKDRAEEIRRNSGESKAAEYIKQHLTLTNITTFMEQTLQAKYSRLIDAPSPQVIMVTVNAALHMSIQITKEEAQGNIALLTQLQNASSQKQSQLTQVRSKINAVTDAGAAREHYNSISPFTFKNPAPQFRSGSNNKN